MTQEQIKNMNEEEFIELIKKYLPKYRVNRIYDNILSKNDKKNYRAVIITLGLLMGIIPIGIAEDIFNKEVPLSYTTITLLCGLLLSYVMCKNSRKKEYIKTKEEFNNRIIKLKNNIANLSDEEFNILIRCYDYIENNEVPNELFDCPNVLEIADKLLEINAVNLLKEFEILENINDIQNSYSDLNINKDKVYKKSN